MNDSTPAALCRRLTSGVYVVGVADGGRVNAFTAAWVMQVAFDPLLVALSVNPGNASYSLLEASGVFVVNVLGAGQQDLARRFGTRSGRDEDKLLGVAWRAGIGGAPILERAVACLACRLVTTVPAGDHRVVIAQATGGELLHPDAAPLRYDETGTMDGSEALYPRTF
jgi:flavin reductase (DIM6/NTAB) family NADH-FMN oxidoreductase RutF